MTNDKNDNVTLRSPGEDIGGFFSYLVPSNYYCMGTKYVSHTLPRPRSVVSGQGVAYVSFPRITISRKQNTISFFGNSYLVGTRYLSRSLKLLFLSLEIVIQGNKIRTNHRYLLPGSVLHSYHERNKC